MAQSCGRKVEKKCSRLAAGVELKFCEDTPFLSILPHSAVYMPDVQTF